MLKYAAAALLAGSTLVSAPAFAQEGGPFTGFRVEAIAGYDRLGSGEEDDESIDGIGYGVGAGFDFNAGPVVVGIEGELSESEAEQDFNETINGTQFLGNIDVGRDIYIGGRLGFTAGPRTLIYGKGGYTNTTINSAFTSTGGNADFDSSIDGWRLGAGVEHLLGPNAYVKAEYRFSNYNGLRLDDTLFGNEDFDIDLDRHQILAGVGFRF